MQPVRLTVPGRYWDTQAYSGCLYLFEDTGSIRTLDWDRVIEGWAIEEHLRLALRCAFQRGDYLYGRQLQLLFSDSEIKGILKNKFEALTSYDLELSQRRLEGTTIKTQDVSFPFPHADSTIYKSNLYVASQSGVFSASCHNSRKSRPLSTRPEKKWDAPVVSVSASYDTLALAAGDEGLWELPINDKGGPCVGLPEPIPISHQTCQECSWAFYSIYGSSHVGSGYLAAFTLEKDQQTSYPAPELLGRSELPSPRTFDRLVSDEEIFEHRGYSWGAQDKLCQVTDGQVQVVRYEPRRAETVERLTNIGSLQLEEWKGDVVSGGVALFGTIVELENAIVILPSQGRPITLPGEPVNWRVFPGSKHYKNQLHVIYEDRLEILSFNHDYFVDQKAKLSGTSYRGFP